VRTRLQTHLGSRQVARVVYGSIIGLALIVALAEHPPGPGAEIVWLLGTAVAVGLAEVYSDVVGHETRTRHRVQRADLRRMSVQATAAAFGVAFPSVFFLLPLAGVGTVDEAFTLAKWTGLFLIGFYGFWAARFAGASVQRALLNASLVALVGAALIVLKSLVH
jgi:hypothetical protein